MEMISAKDAKQTNFYVSFINGPIHFIFAKNVCLENSNMNVQEIYQKPVYDKIKFIFFL